MEVGGTSCENACETSRWTSAGREEPGHWRVATRATMGANTNSDETQPTRWEGKRGMRSARLGMPEFRNPRGDARRNMEGKEENMERARGKDP